MVIIMCTCVVIGKHRTLKICHIYHGPLCVGGNLIIQNHDPFNEHISKGSPRCNIIDFLKKRSIGPPGFQ